MSGIILLPIVEIIRLEENYDYGTFGVLRINKQVHCVTLERHDIINKVNVSSIPAQQYECVRTISPTFGETFEVLNVPGRDSILFHSGNVLSNTEGCILLGTKYGELNGVRGILDSRTAFNKFMDVLYNESRFILTIKEEY